MADFLKEQLQAMDARLAELRPLHEEFLKLEKARAALAGLDGPARRGPGRPRGSRSSNGRRRRRRRGGTRAEQALKVVRRQPGVTVRELSDKLGVKHPNYMYRVMNELQSDGAVKKQGKGYVAA